MKLAGNRSDAEVAFRRSIKVLGGIQSRPDLAQTLLAYGRFKDDEDADESKQILNQALEQFRQINATGDTSTIAPRGMSESPGCRHVATGFGVGDRIGGKGERALFLHLQ